MDLATFSKFKIKERKVQRKEKERKKKERKRKKERNLCLGLCAGWI